MNLLIRNEVAKEEALDDKTDTGGGTKSAMMQSYDAGPEEKGATGGMPAVV